MKYLSLFTLLLLLPALQAEEFVDFDGKTISGRLLKFAPGELEYRDPAGQTQKLPLAQLMAIRWNRDQPANPADPAPSIELVTSDQSLFRLTAAASDGRALTMTSSALGQLQAPQSIVRSIRFGASDPAIEEQWLTLQQESGSDDRLVIRKQNVLDYLSGVVESYNEESITFLYDANPISVPRSKVFGMIFAEGSAPAQKPVGQLKLASGELVNAAAISLTEDHFQINTPAQITFSVSRDELREIDLSLGRVVFLSDLEPEGIEYTPFFNIVWELQRDRTLEGEPLRIGDEEFQKGVQIHSKTLVTYRLAKKFRQFRCVMGIDELVAVNGYGHVLVRISGDDRVLLERTVDAFDGPIDLNLDVSAVRFLQILVDWGEGLDRSDRLNLANARLIQ